MALTQGGASEVNQPRNALAIPGVNDFLPLAATPEILAGLFVGLFVHEFGHGVLSRVEGISVESAGLIVLAVVPFGAFVGIDEDDEREAETSSRNRIYAAGIANNLALAAVAVGCLVLLVSTSIAAVPGVAVGGVYPGTPADEAGLERGDVITAVDGERIESDDDHREALEAANDSVELGVEGARDGTKTVTIERSVVVTSALAGSGDGGGDGEATALEPGQTITAVDGEAVATEREFATALENATVVDLETDDGSGPRTVVAGVAVSDVDSDGALAAAGVLDPGDEPDSLVITVLDGERIVDDGDLFDALEDAEPGETVTLEAAVDGEVETYAVTLGERDGDAALGVALAPGTSGITVTDLGVDAHPHEQHLAVLSGDVGAGDGLDASVLAGALALFALPFAGMIDGVSSANFGGFVGSVADFYTVTGSLAALEGVVFVVATLLFWAWWLNLLLGVFNCIPCYPLDGAKILRTTVEDVGSRIGLESPARVASAAMVGASGLVGVAIALVLASPFLVG
ncbi:site-2 protease family protein [Natronolimnohabitans innermongolicus]